MNNKNINKKALEVIWRTDGYKLGHVNQLPEGITRIYSNLTPRSVYGGANEEMPPVVVMYGLKAFLVKLQEDFRYFFQSDIDEVERMYVERIQKFTGQSDVKTDHIKKLHDLQYLPLEIKSLREGALGLIGHPVLTITNTDPSAYWLVNYLETWLSSSLWHPITSATKAWNIRRMMDDFAVETGADPKFNDFMAHDFSYRGLPGIESASLSGSAHLTSFLGSDSLSSWDLIENIYPETDGSIQVGVPATEHSVMCTGAKRNPDGTMDERDQIQRILDAYPSGIVSVVSDSYDYWGMLTDILPEFKDQIMNRDGKWVVRPDSGNPVDIICGDPEADEGTPERKGSLRVLWDIFGGTENDKGYKVLDSHIGLIYGDSMNWKVVHEMFTRMKEMGFATNNIVIGIGSFTYQYVTRDTLGMAVKCTWAKINGEPKPVMKDPKTGGAHTKKSAYGLLKLVDDGNERKFIQNVSEHDESESNENDVLRTVFFNGEIINMDDNFQDIRKRLLIQTQVAKERNWV